MLGRLARFMRFRGYDVLYDNKAEDEFLRRRSRYRIVLTKDRGLAKLIRDGRVYLVKTTGAETQLREILQAFPEQKSSRCIECNGKLSRIRKRKIEHLIPPFVFRKYDAFYFCRVCRRVYWAGSHYERASRVLE